MWKICTLLLLVHHSFSFNMEEITIEPGVGSGTIDPEKIKDIIMTFESRRSSSLHVAETRLSLGDVVDLCEALVNDQSASDAINSGKGSIFIPVKPIPGQPMNEFTSPCYGWIRKRCLGRAKPPFDYRCHFWVPYYIFQGAECAPRIELLRKKRFATFFESSVVSGFEAVTLCSTHNQIDLSKVFTVDAVALPTNEASPLRCINWLLSPEGGWIKEELGKEACEAMNKRRPHAESESEVSEGVIEDIYSDIVTCTSRGNIIDCLFLRPNIRNPVLL